jgi:DNA polymerase III subunit delta
VKAEKGRLPAALDRPDPDIRFYLFYGPDESQSRAHADRLLAGLEAEKFVVPAQSAKTDPAMLADEAAAMALFGGKRALWIDPAGDEIVAAVEALFEATAAESPAIAIAGSLRKTSPLLKLAESHGRALAHASYELDKRDSERLVTEMARSEGLRLQPGIAALIAQSAGNERGIIAQELGKIALYVGATPERPVEIGREIVDSIGAGAEGDWMRLGDLALAGDVDALCDALDSTATDAEAIPVLRALQRRLLMLAPIRSRVENGQRPHDAVTSAGKSVFWKEKGLVEKMVTVWDSAALARVLQRSGELERRLMRPDCPPIAAALQEELTTIARTARRR